MKKSRLAVVAAVIGAGCTGVIMMLLAPPDPTPSLGVEPIVVVGELPADGSPRNADDHQQTTTSLEGDPAEPADPSEVTTTAVESPVVPPTTTKPIGSTQRSSTQRSGAVALRPTAPRDAGDDDDDQDDADEDHDDDTDDDDERR